MHSVPKGAETHFKVVVASDAFEGKSLVNRHRAVNQLLQDELAAGLHALTMTTLTASEWGQSPEVKSSPACLGGSKADRQAG
jgi:BolA protein